MSTSPTDGDISYESPDVVGKFAAAVYPGIEYETSETLLPSQIRTTVEPTGSSGHTERKSFRRQKFFIPAL